MPTRIRLERTDWLNHALFPARMIIVVPITGNNAQPPGKSWSWLINSKPTDKSSSPKIDSTWLTTVLLESLALKKVNLMKSAWTQKANKPQALLWIDKFYILQKQWPDKPLLKDSSTILSTYQRYHSQPIWPQISSRKSSQTSSKLVSILPIKFVLELTEQEIASPPDSGKVIESRGRHFSDPFIYLGSGGTAYMYYRLYNYATRIQQKD